MGRVKRNLETSSALRVLSAPPAEAQAAAVLAGAVANDPEASADLVAVSVRFRDELAAPPTLVDAGRREHLLAEWASAAAKFAPHA